MQACASDDVEEGASSRSPSCLGPLSYAELTRPVEVGDCTVSEPPRFWSWPLLGPLLFENDGSDARDHCANERTFLSYLRLSVYMAVVAVAITLSFHLKTQPTAVELRMAWPLGLVFWVLAVACLTLGLANYVKTVNKYSKKAALVQSGWRTQTIMTLIAITIIITCIILLVVAKVKVEFECDTLDGRCAREVANYIRILAFP